MCLCYDTAQDAYEMRNNARLFPGEPAGGLENNAQIIDSQLRAATDIIRSYVRPAGSLFKYRHTARVVRLVNPFAYPSIIFFFLLAFSLNLNVILTYG